MPRESLLAGVFISWRRRACYLQHMGIPVLLFASYADAFGAPQVDVPIAAPCQVHELVDVMRSLPGGVRLPSSPLVAVNRTWAGSAATIVVGDEVALIPPVAGG